MRTAFPKDPVLSGLQTLSQEDLSRITGAAEVEVLRLRHHPGLRAALHVALGIGKTRREGVIWFLSREKLLHLRIKRPHLRIDEKIPAAFEAFPMDHRLPELATFLNESRDLAPRLLGCNAQSLPQIVRYRPGLSATFRWMSDDGRPFFVKVARNMQAQAHADLHARLERQIEGSILGLTPVTGLLAERGIIAYAAAQGESLEDILVEGDTEAITTTLNRCHEAMRVLWSCDAPALLAMTLDDYLLPARRAASLILDADVEAGQQARRIIESCAANPPVLHHVPLHADLKPDHLFVESSRVTMIDTESMKRGDPDFDLALLDARLDLGSVIGTFSTEASIAARKVLWQAAGPNFHWFQGLARIHAAKFLALRDGASAAQDIRKVLLA